VRLEVVRVLGLASLQDFGVHGFMHEALPPGGALVPELLAFANHSVGNAGDAIGIEIQGRLVVRATERLIVAIDDQAARTLQHGDELEILSGPRRCAYLAVRGGVVGPLWQGRARGAVVSAGIGGPLVVGATIAVGSPPVVGATIAVRASRAAGPTHPAGAMLGAGATFGAGDSLAVGADAPALSSTTASPPRFVEGDTITIIAGPDLDAFAADALTILAALPYRILPASNRVGTRLAGPVLPCRPEYRERSRPMVQGALEVPRDGQPIVLGPEHPTTGGYPVIGVIASAELGRFHAIRLGGSVRFRVRVTSPSR